MPSPWWTFALDDTRADTHANRLRDESGEPLVNPPGDSGRRGLDYSQYLHLDRLLEAQTPASTVPDERIFVVIHQLFELVFKQMTFDLGVIAATFERLIERDNESLLLEPLPDASGPSAFWRPAMTAAARLRHSARRVLPAVMTYVGRGEDDDVLFSTLEYALFREHLAPASGFQTAQLRLIQRALGKGPLLGLRVFPGDTYGEHYTGTPCGHVALGDPLVLREGHARAFPDEGEPAARVAALDRLAHTLLAHLAGPDADLPTPPAVRLIHEAEVERTAARVRATMGDHAEAEAITTAFRSDLETEVAEENKRREALGDARRGAQVLHTRHARTNLAFVLDRLAATDAALHAPEADAFLTVHRKTVRRHVQGEGGTGGGGMPYLVTSQRFLLPLFPALVAYSDLGVTGTDENEERW